MKARGDWSMEIKKYSAHRSCLSWRFGKQRVRVYFLGIMPWKWVLQSGSSMCHIFPLSTVTHWLPVAAKIWRKIWSKNSHLSQSRGIWWVTSLCQENLLSRWSMEISVEDCPSSLFLKASKIILKKQERGEREKITVELHIGDLDDAKDEQQGSCVGHECINKSFLTCKTGKGWGFFTVLLVLTSACGLSVDVLVLNGCKESVFVMSEEGKLSQRHKNIIWLGQSRHISALSSIEILPERQSSCRLDLSGVISSWCSVNEYSCFLIVVFVVVVGKDHNLSFFPPQSGYLLFFAAAYVAYLKNSNRFLSDQYCVKSLGCKCFLLLWSVCGQCLGSPKQKCGELDHGLQFLRVVWCKRNKTPTQQEPRENFQEEKKKNSSYLPPE